MPGLEPRACKRMQLETRLCGGQNPEITVACGSVTTEEEAKTPTLHTPPERSGEQQSAESTQLLCTPDQKENLPATLLPVGVALVHGVANIHRRMVVPVASLDGLF